MSRAKPGALVRLPVLLAVLLAGLLAGCGSGDSASGAGGESGTTTIDITISRGTVDPDGAEQTVGAGDPIRLHIVADVSGVLHVHSSPEQEISYSAGTTDKTIRLERPGVVDVEDHHLDKLVVQLTVR